MLKSPFSRLTYAILSPFGDHAGEALYLPMNVSLLALPPCESITNIWGEPERSELKATSRQFGDHVGEVSIAALCVSLLRPPPSLPTVYISELPSLLSVSAILSPSGDHDPAMLSPGWNEGIDRKSTR